MSWQPLHRALHQLSELQESVGYLILPSEVYKQAITRLCEQVVSLGDQVKTLQGQLDDSAQQADRAEQLASRNADLAKTNATLRSKLSSAIGLLRKWQQHSLRGSSAGEDSGGAPGDIDAFTASCADLNLDTGTSTSGQEPPSSHSRPASAPVVELSLIHI